MILNILLAASIVASIIALIECIRNKKSVQSKIIWSITILVGTSLVYLIPNEAKDIINNQKSDSTSDSKVDTHNFPLTKVQDTNNIISNPERADNTKHSVLYKEKNNLVDQQNQKLLINQPTEQPKETVKKPKCEIENLGNYTFVNKTDLELRLILHLGHKDIEFLVKPYQAKSFYELNAGPIIYEITNDEAPGTFHGYNDPNKPLPKPPRRYYDKGSIYIIACRDITFNIE